MVWGAYRPLNASLTFNVHKYTRPIVRIGLRFQRVAATQIKADLRAL
ncbi:hypothetical protein SAMN05444414_13127 [Roseovarius marisflavi]|uniref:Uncharacterized protein n=1 Tax=Roseovarius marisflavi TaxID=1054996 RepID=A0A1M7CWW8_9RHOB|nr:hypothetical protein SAMN05444414_13127 [Roseovarius marisflavi]